VPRPRWNAESEPEHWKREFRVDVAFITERPGLRETRAETNNGDVRDNPDARNQAMCRNIKMLFNFDPPVTEEEIRAASLQYVRKISGFASPSHANEAAFNRAVDEVAAVSARLLSSLETMAPHRNRDEEAAKAKARGMARFGT
jgi:hypothetical protein